MNLRVVITWQDLAPCFSGGCVRPAIGRAAARSASAAGIVLPADFPLPEAILAFVRRFDRGEPVGPIQFDLPIPERPRRLLGDTRTRSRRPDGQFQAPAGEDRHDHA